MRWVLPVCLVACSSSSTPSKKPAPPEPGWHERVTKIFTTLTTPATLHPGVVSGG